MTTVPYDLLESVRHFNRFYTRHMGLFSRDYLQVGLSVTELRMLYEISVGDRQAREIAQELNIDEGYVSRIIKRFVAKGWAKAIPSKTDARRKDLSLTAKGRAVYEDIAEKTRVETARRLGSADPLRVVEVMQQLERLLLPLDPAQITFRGLRPGDFGWVIQRNAETYHSAFGFDETFEVFVGKIMMEMCEAFDSKTHAATIACLGPDRLGSIFCVPGDAPGLAKLRVFFVEPHARGLRLGHELMERCLDQARGLGYSRMELMTVDGQKAARHLYAAYGFTLVAETPVRLAGRNVIEEKWARDL